MQIHQHAVDVGKHRIRRGKLRIHLHGFFQVLDGLKRGRQRALFVQYAAA